MKKINIIFFTFLLVIFSFSCATTSNTEDKDVFLKATKKGIVISFPDSAINKASHGYIYRYVKDDNGKMIEQMCIQCSRVKDYKQKEVIDYFVVEGKDYYYKAKFWGRGVKEVNVPLTPVTAIGGCGEITVPNNVRGTFDEESNVMTFNPALSFSKEINDFVNKHKDMETVMALRYYCPYLASLGEHSRLVPHIENNKAPFFKNGGIILNKLYGQKLIFDTFHVNVQDVKKAVSYSVSTSNIDVPKEIVIKDVRKKLGVEQLESGVKITLPPVPEEYKKLDNLMGEFHVLENGERDKKEIIVHFNEDFSNLTFIDPFVRKGVTYEYNYTLTSNREVLLSTFPETVTYNGNTSFINSFNSPVASYNKGSSNLTFTTLSSFNDDIKDIIGTDKRIECSIIYEVDKPDPTMLYLNSQLHIRTNEDTKNVRIKDLDYHDFICNKPLHVVSYETNVWNNYISFYNHFDASLIKENSMPELIISK